MDDLPQPNYGKSSSFAGLVVGLSCLGLLLMGVSLVGGVLLVSRTRRAEALEAEQLRVETLASREQAEERQEQEGVTLLLAGRSADRGQVEATAEVLRERLRLAGIQGRVEVRGDLRLQVKLPGEGVESALDLLLAGGDLQFKLVSTLDGEARDVAIREVEAAKAAGAWDSEVAEYDVGHTADGATVLLENPGVPGYLLTKVGPATDAQGNPAIGFEFGEQGRARFGELTGDNVGRNLAIMLDGVVRDTPTILDRIEGSGIINNPGGFAKDVQQRLITVLQSGKLPVDLDLESSQTGG